jgi:putative endonuclease
VKKSKADREAAAAAREQRRQIRTAEAAAREQRRQIRFLREAASPHGGVTMPRSPGASAETIDAGAVGEDLAARLLIAKGYRIVQRNYRCTSGELDLVANDAGVLVFVEVRSRGSAGHGDAVDSVTAAKRGKVTQVAAHYLHHKQPVFDECRFDVIAIDGPGQIDHYEDAWRLGGILK